jgi:hypothetical protein
MPMDVSSYASDAAALVLLAPGREELPHDRRDLRLQGGHRGRRNG